MITNAFTNTQHTLYTHTPHTLTYTYTNTHTQTGTLIYIYHLHDPLPHFITNVSTKMNRWALRSLSPLVGQTVDPHSSWEQTITL